MTAAVMTHRPLPPPRPLRHAAVAFRCETTATALDGGAREVILATYRATTPRLAARWLWSQAERLADLLDRTPAAPQLQDAPLTTAVLTDLESRLREHVACSFRTPVPRPSACGPYSTAGYLLRSRIEAIERQAEQGLGEGTLAVHVQVAQLARDCRWLLEQRHGAGTRP
jgi:hypothetical protein